jgi:sulfoacetaldehyde dehydrogenase
VGRDHPFSREKLSPVLAFYREPDFAAARARAIALLRHQGAGHSIGLHSRTSDRATALGLTLPVARVIVNQAHCFATGRQLRQRAAVLAVDGLRHVGR